MSEWKRLAAERRWYVQSKPDDAPCNGTKKKRLDKRYRVVYRIGFKDRKLWNKEFGR